MSGRETAVYKNMQNDYVCELEMYDVITWTRIDILVFISKWQDTRIRNTYVTEVSPKSADLMKLVWGVSGMYEFGEIWSPHNFGNEVILVGFSFRSVHEATKLTLFSLPV